MLYLLMMLSSMYTSVTSTTYDYFQFVLCYSLQNATESTTGHRQLVWIAVLWQSNGLSQSTQRGIYQG